MMELNSTANENNNNSRNIIFVSLGMVLIDELRFSKQETRQDVSEGSGMYGAVSCVRIEKIV